MRISFDIDDTLVLHSLGAAPMERGRFPGFICRWLGEPLRPGTCALMRRLREQGCSVWIYTSSGRTEFSVRLWLFLYGISVDGVINKQRHRRQLRLLNYPRELSKFPLAFNIDLHVDDSDGVRLEGLKHGFKVVVVNPSDAQWVEKVLDAVNEVRLQRQLVNPSPAAASTPQGMPPGLY